LRHSAGYVEFAAAAYVSPILFGFLKFGRLTSYHTRLVTVAAYLMGIAVIAFFAGWSALPLRVACLVLVLSQLEEIAITATLSSWHANVRDLRQARQIRQREAQTRALAGERSHIN
jgi:CDP-diacylglycerol--glycerol-3-phosphate 3-phosphatidyltransferase